MLLWQIDALEAARPASGGLVAGVLMLGVGVAVEVILARGGLTSDPVVRAGENQAPRRATLLLPWTVLAWTAGGCAVVSVVGACSAG